MGKLFVEFWDKSKRFLGDFYDTKNKTKFGWHGCKAKVIEILKADAHTNISDKQRTWEDVFRDL